MQDPHLSPETVHASRKRIERMSYWLDECLRIPVLGWRFGLDSIIGLVPVAGDVVGMGLGLLLVGEGLRLGAPTHLIARMLANCGLDLVVGFVPLLGDVMDVALKSNRRNRKLLIAHLDAQAPPLKPRARQWLPGVLLLIGAIVAALAAAWALVRYL